MRELLTDLRGDFDVIVIDAPPVLPVADARVLCEMADVTIQVARLGVTTKTALRRAHELLTVYSKRPVGVVLNAVAEGSGAYHDYYGYRDFNDWGKEATMRMLKGLLLAACLTTTLLAQKESMLIGSGR